MVWTAVVPVGNGTLRELARHAVGVPSYDRARLVGRIAHVGVGGFHRAHLARYVDELAANGSTWGIVGVGLLPPDEAMARALGAQDHLYTLIERGPAEPTVQVVGSIVDYRLAHDDRTPAIEALAHPDVAIISLTITEAGYVEGTATFDVLAQALAARHARGVGPVTLMSCDNVPGNGDATRRATLAATVAHGTGLYEWVQAECTFPNSMVDRITPVTTAADREWLRETHGVDDRWPVVAEPFRQWVVEDAFAAGRPSWEDAGVLISDRVHEWELYKLRLLNASHSALAYLGQLAGLTFVDEAMTTPPVRQFVERLLIDEAVPSLAEIPGHPREDYVASVLERFANRGVRDQLARLCIDGTSKFATFLVPSIVHQLANDGPVERSATALAGWARYLAHVPVEEQARDDRGGLARALAHRAGDDDPLCFLDLREVFPAEVRDSSRFRAAFARAWHAIGDRGPLAAMAG